MEVVEQGIVSEQKQAAMEALVAAASEVQLPVEMLEEIQQQTRGLPVECQGRHRHLGTKTVEEEVVVVLESLVPMVTEI